MAQWPGYAGDIAERWLSAGLKRSDVDAPKALTPKAVKDRSQNKRALAADGLARVRESHAPWQNDHRNALVSGDSTRPNMTIAMMLRFVPKGRQVVIDLMQYAAQNGDISAKRWWAVWSDLRVSEQERVDLNSICEVASVPPKEFMSIAISTAMELGADMADLTAAIMHPKIVRQTAKSALRIGGDHADIALADRRMMLEHGKFIAPPKGISITQNASAHAAAAAAAAQPSVPTFMDSIRSAGNAQREIQRKIAASVDAEVAE